MVFKNCTTNAAQYIGMQIPGEGKSRYTKHLTAGILITEGIVLPITKNKVEGEWVYVPSDGRRGGTKRVWKCFPVIRSWEGDVMIYVLDDKITPEVLRYHLEQGGSFIGIGRFRPINNGYYGRFKIKDMIWQDGK
jgi:hypothetical protein